MVMRNIFMVGSALELYDQKIVRFKIVSRKKNETGLGRKFAARRNRLSKNPEGYS